MTITLYKYLGEREKVDKSSDLSFILSTSGKFKGDVSITSPVLILTLPVGGVEYVTDENGNEIEDIIAIDETGEVINFNYFYIEEFRRFYFLSSLSVSSGNVAIVTGSVDPLYSFKDQILRNSAMVARNEFEYNEFLEDSALPLETMPRVIEGVVHEGSRVNTRFDTNFSTLKRNLSVAVTATKADSDIIRGVSPLPDINTRLFSSSGGTRIFSFDSENAYKLFLDLLENLTQYGTYFKNLVAYPFDLEGDSVGEVENIWFVDFATQTRQTLQVEGKEILPQSNYKIVADFTLPAVNSFLDVPPYSNYEIYLPFYGYIDLNIKENASCRCLVYYSVNYEDGTAQVYVYNKDRARVIFSAPCQLGIPLSLSKSNAQEINTLKQNAQNNAILGIIGSTISGLGSHGGMGIAMGALGISSSLVAYNNTLAQLWTKTTATNNGTTGGLYTSLNVRIKSVKNRALIGLDMSKYAHQYGRPLRQIRTLSDLHGFTSISSIHLEGVEALQVEKDSIISSLLSGVIL